MSYWSGNGGYVLVGATTANIGRWELRKNARLVENTHSGVTSSNYENVVPDHSWSLDIPWDDAALPDTDLGLTEGSKVTIVFRYGTSGKTAALTNTSVESLDEVDDNANDIVRVRVSGKGGALTRPVT